jgi:hypothetical protein
VAGILPSLQIFAGNGNGTFQAPQQMWVPGTGFPNWDTIADASAVTIADVDADGKADLVAACQYEWPWGYDPESTAAPIIYYGKYVPVLRGNGNGTFTTAFVSPSIDSGVSRMFPNVHTRDLNGDSQLDLVFAYEGRVDVLFGAGNATFSAGPSYNWPAGSPTTGRLDHWCWRISTRTERRTSRGRAWVSPWVWARAAAVSRHPSTTPWAHHGLHRRWKRRTSTATAAATSSSPVGNSPALLPTGRSTCF